MRILLLASHAVAEYDDIRMFHDLGFEVFAPGGYENPNRSGEGIRPALPQVPYHADLHAACERMRAQMGTPGTMIDWAKAHIPDEVLDWADVIIVHHFPQVWIGRQWERIRHKRVIWRTCGQSDPALERYMATYVRRGLQVVRYSPREAIAFGADFAGQDALIRFAKYPADYGPWYGMDVAVANVTQRMTERGNACGLDYYLAATEGLPARPAGEGSEQLPGGIGQLSYDAMLSYLRRMRVYLYTGTRPASYTLGLIEAALTGIPIVSIGPGAFGLDLFEGHELASDGGPDYDDPAVARAKLQGYLDDATRARRAGRLTALAARDKFDVEVVGPQWVEFLR